MGHVIVVQLDDFVSIVQSERPQHLFRLRHEGDYYLVLIDKCIPIAAIIEQPEHISQRTFTIAEHTSVAIIDCGLGTRLF